jgi:hypothetical protein
VCLLAVVFKVVDHVPVIVGANREEAYARGGEPPRLLDGCLRCVAGIDPIAQGTWLGVNERGALIAVTNRPKSKVPDRPRSRGVLARELLNMETAEEASRHAFAELQTGRFAGCNYLCMDQRRAFVIHAGDVLQTLPLEPGVHVLTARDVNDRSDSRLAYALDALQGRAFDGMGECIGALRQLCGDNGNGHPPMVLRGDLGGTVSSTIVALSSNLKHGTYLHAQGAPDITPFDDYSQLLRQLAAGAGATN